MPFQYISLNLYYVSSVISSCKSIESRPTLQIERRDNDGRTAVMAAARTGKLRLLQELVARGADLGRQDDQLVNI